MARVTVEDCLEHVENRFHLVILAAKRARQLATTAAEAAVDMDDDKYTVVALREIAQGSTNLYEKEVERMKHAQPQHTDDAA